MDNHSSSSSSNSSLSNWSFSTLTESLSSSNIVVSERTDSLASNIHTQGYVPGLSENEIDILLAPVKAGLIADRISLTTNDTSNSNSAAYQMIDSLNEVHSMRTRQNFEINLRDESIPRRLLEAARAIFVKNGPYTAIPGSRSPSYISITHFSDSVSVNSSHFLIKPSQRSTPTLVVPQVALSISSNENQDSEPGLVDTLLQCCCCGWLVSLFGKIIAKLLILIFAVLIVGGCVTGVVVLLGVLTTDNRNSTEISHKIAHTTTLFIYKLTPTDQNSRTGISYSTTHSSSTNLETSLPTITTNQPLSTTEFATSQITTPKTTRETIFSSMSISKLSATSTSTPVFQTTTRKT